MTIAASRTGYLNGTTSGWAAASLFAVGDDLYAVVLDTSGVAIRVHKSTDGSTWTEQDSGDALTHTDATHSYGAGMPLSGTGAGFIYVAYRTATNTLRVRRFDTSTDTWEGTDIGAANATTVAHTDYNVRVAVRSDGDVHLMFRGSASNDISWCRYEGSGWSGVTVMFATATSYALEALMTDNGDLIHVFYYVDPTGDDFGHKSIDNANTQGTAAAVDNSSSRSWSQFGGYVNDGGTHRIACLNRDSTGEADLHHVTSTANPTFTAVDGVSPTSTTDIGALGGVVVPYNSAWHCVWSGNGRGAIHYDVSDDYASPAFGADSSPVTGLAANDPVVHACAAPTGVAALYTVLTATPTVEIVWVAGSPPAGGPVTVSVPVSTATSAAPVLSVSTGANTIRSFAVLIG